MKPFLNWVGAHKVAAAIALLAIAGGGYYGYSKYTKGTASAQYVTAVAEKGTLVVSVSGSGQVSALNQIDVKPEASGRIIAIPVLNGQRVAAGQILGRLDTEDAGKAIRDAAVNVESAKLQLTILKESGANVDTLVSNTYNELSNTFLDLPTVMTGLNDALHDKVIVSYLNLIDPQDRDGITVLVNSAEASYQSARSAYDAAFAQYHTLSRTDAQGVIIAFANETVDVATKTADAIKNTTNIIDYVNDYYTQRGRTIPSPYAALVTKHKSDLSNYTAAVNPHIASLASDIASITNAPYNIASQELAVRQRENALADANEAIANYVIRAPFSGTIASISPKVGDTVSPSAIFATIISPSRYASVSLNEVDVSRVALGQKATLTFEAIDGLSLTGKVIEIDTIGTVTQGVVTYNVKIGFQGDDARVRPGMSVSASIITDVRQDVVLVPSAAVKTQGNERYVEIVSGGAPSAGTSTGVMSGTVATERRPVEVGASNDTMTEITKGLNEGDVVVVRSVTATTNSTSQSQGGGLRLPGLGGVGR